MTQQSNNPTRRPKPGPRPRPRPSPAPHGTVRRRTGSPTKKQPTKKQAPAAKRPHDPTSIPQRKSSPKSDRTSNEATAERIQVRWWLLGTIALVAAIVISVLEAPMFEAQSVQLSGNARTSDGLVFEALAIPDDQALLLYDIDAAEEAVAALPWVREVDIARQWPGTVQVVIRERGVAASIGLPDGTEWVVLSEDGVVVERRATPPANVPLIVGTDAIVGGARIGEPVDEARHALEVALDVPGQIDPWITTWSLDDSGSLTAELIGSAQANFGAFEDPRTQFVSLASILNGGAELTCLSRIDLSVADTPVLHRDPACIAQSAELG